MKSESKTNLLTKSEVDYLRNYIEEYVKSDLSRFEEVTFKQLRALWTTYCLIADLNVDTYKYFVQLDGIWTDIVQSEQSCNFQSFDEFDAFMSEDLV